MLRHWSIMQDISSMTGAAPFLSEVHFHTCSLKFCTPIKSWSINGHCDQIVPFYLSFLDLLLLLLEESCWDSSDVLLGACEELPQFRHECQGIFSIEESRQVDLHILWVRVLRNKWHTSCKLLHLGKYIFNCKQVHLLNRICLNNCIFLYVL